MSFNDKIKKLIAFSEEFSTYKKRVELENKKLNDEIKTLKEQLTIASDTSAIESLSEKVDNVLISEKVIDSSARSYGEQIGILKSYVDKELIKIKEVINHGE